MSVLLLISIFVFLFICSKLYKKIKIIKNKKIISFSKSNLYDWMNLTKKERYNLSKKESSAYLDKRKILLEKIRAEYKSISKEKKTNI